jgi:hypothetical protein
MKSVSSQLPVFKKLKRLYDQFLDFGHIISIVDISCWPCRRPLHHKDLKSRLLISLHLVHDVSFLLLCIVYTTGYFWDVSIR